MGIVVMMMIQLEAYMANAVLMCFETAIRT